MLFEAFKRNRQERPEGEAFLIPSGDRYFPVSWKRFTDDIALVAWIVDTYAPCGVVAILGENCYDWMVVHAAVLFRGGTVVPVDPNLTSEEIARRLKVVGANALIHSSLYSDKAHAVARLTPGLATGGFGTRKTDIVLLAAKTAFKVGCKSLWEREAPETAPHTATIVFTSGTTSEPRGVELTIEAIETFIRSSEISVPMNPGDRSLMLLPLHHIYGICATYAMLARGVALGVCPDFRRIYDAFERFRANFAFLVPALADILAAKIEHHGKSAEETFGQPIDWIVTGGAPLSRRTYERLTALGIKTMCAYGLTETCACYSMSWASDAPHPCSAGKASQLPEVETRVSDEGELLIRGPNVMKGYYKMPERTAKAIDPDGWFHTGDRGQIDADGYVWVTGRASRTIVLSSGKKIAPEELEEKILQLPGVLETLVSGEGESRDVKAEIYASVPEETIRRAVAALNQTLPVYQRIKTVAIRKEPFPRTSSGKIKVG